MDNKKDVLDSARELGYAITESVEYKDLIKAEENYLNDNKLNKTIEELKTTKDMYSSATNLEDHEVNMYKAQIRHLQEILDTNDNMKNLVAAQADYDRIFKNINNLISYVTDDESRIKIKSEKKNCSSCSGCSKK